VTPVPSRSRDPWLRAKVEAKVVHVPVGASH
jgi:hypothetical protein